MSIDPPEPNPALAVLFSQGFRSQGGIYAMLESGERLDGLLGEEVDTHFDRLRQAGAFEGRVLVVENIWQTMMPSGLGYFQAVSTAIPDDLGGTALHSHHLSIEQDDYDAAVRDGRTFRILKR